MVTPELGVTSRRSRMAKTLKKMGRGTKAWAGKEVYIAPHTVDYALDPAVTGDNLLTTGDVVEHIDVPAGCLVIGAALKVDRAVTGLTSPTVTLKIGATALTSAVTPVTGTVFPSTTGAPAVAAVASGAKCTLTFGGTGTVTDPGAYTVSLVLAQI
jgi:hypothetical protein